MNRPIRFSHKYEKMPLDIKTAFLLGVEAWDIEKLVKAAPSFIDYDTEYQDKEGYSLYYQLPKKGEVMVLFLWGNCGGGLHILFTTIRSRFGRRGLDKLEYYHGKIGEEFPIEIEEV